MEGMPGEPQFSFVSHSMGGIVVRHLVGDLQRDDPRDLLKRCRSLVMLGPPNQGASIARRLARTGVFGLLTGKAALELGPRWDEFQQRLATPPFPFAIVAGDLSHNPIRNPLVDGDSDLIVSVDEARLEGAEWFKVVPVMHSLLMNDETVQNLTAEFIAQHWSHDPDDPPGIQQP
jgi:pimeloyl-ACP methyl ester carboxylesterase